MQRHLSEYYTVQSSIMAHELSHGFSLYLDSLYGVTTLTPPMTPSINGNLVHVTHRRDRSRGEAGNAFEYLAYGGTMDLHPVSMAALENFDMPLHKALRLVINTEVDNRFKDYFVSHETVKAFLHIGSSTG